MDWQAHILDQVDSANPIQEDLAPVQLVEEDLQDLALHQAQ